MSLPSVSFIIPYYKIEIPLLARAVESIVRLGGHADWEVWVIDDGTPGREAAEYVAALDNPRVRYHAQANSGLGGARNTGMELASKEYIHFLDADDYLLFSPACRALRLLGQLQPELLRFELHHVSDKTLADCTHFKTHVSFRGSGTAFMLRHNLHGSACSYFFRKSLAGGLRFTPHIYHEDEEFTALLFIKAQDVLITSLPVYAYYRRTDSITHHKDRKVIEKRFTDLLQLIGRLKGKARTLPQPEAAALTRRADLLSMAMIYTLWRDSPDIRFLTGMLERMRATGLYPLPCRCHSIPYVLIRMASLTPSIAALTGSLVRLIRSFRPGQKP